MSSRVQKQWMARQAISKTSPIIMLDKIMMASGGRAWAKFLSEKTGMTWEYDGIDGRGKYSFLAYDGEFSLVVEVVSDTRELRASAIAWRFVQGRHQEVARNLASYVTPVTLVRTPEVLFDSAFVKRLRNSASIAPIDVSQLDALVSQAERAYAQAKSLKNDSTNTDRLKKGLYELSVICRAMLDDVHDLRGNL